jgi:hypothetical protein
VSTNNTIREAFAELLNSFEVDGIESILFTTFNYSSTFFENNILPLIAAYPDTDVENMIDEQINGSLAAIKVAVICDRTTNPEPKGNYRYGLLSCGLTNAYFHPKIILIKGKLKDRMHGCKLMVLSANLTLSGWGLNREIAGSCLVGSQQAKELAKLLTWLSTQATKQTLSDENKNTTNVDEGDLIAHLQTLQSFFSINDNFNDYPEEPELYIRIPSKNNNNTFFSRMLNNCSKPLHEFTVISPFWSEAKDLSPMLNDIGCSTITLVPSIDLQGNRKLPKSIRNEFKKGFDCVSYADFKENDRYTHAKAIELNGEKGSNYLATGSANFTQAAMGNETLGNIEAMLLYNLKKPGQIAKQISTIDEESINWAEKNEADDTPPPIPPFQASASYNWKTHEFVCTVECNDVVLNNINSVTFSNKSLKKLNKIDQEKFQRSLTINLAKPIYHFDINYHSNENENSTFRGLVTQWNAQDDELHYRPQPKLSKLIDQLRALDPNKPPGHGGGFSSKSGTTAKGEDDELDEVFDFFFIFQAFYKLRGYFDKHPDSDPFKPYTANSISVLFRAIKLEKPISNAQHIRYYILLSELKTTSDKLKEKHQSTESINLCTEINNELKQYEATFINLLKDSPMLEQLIGKKSSKTASKKSSTAAAKAILKWFKDEL